VKGQPAAFSVVPCEGISTNRPVKAFVPHATTSFSPISLGAISIARQSIHQNITEILTSKNLLPSPMEAADRYVLSNVTVDLFFVMD
jgi:hypothetical protein